LAAPVEVLVHGVERRLVARIGMNGRHHALFDADGIIQRLGDRRQAVGGAGGVGDDQMLLGELLVVHAIDDGEVGAVGRRGNEDALGASGQQARRLVASGEDARAFQRDVDAQLAERQGGRILDCGDLDRTGSDVDRVARHGDHAGETAVDRIITHKMGVGLDRAEVVQADDLDVGAAGLDDGAQDVAADAAKTVDEDLNRHFDALLE
jgi:hypothetical protein